MGRGRCGRPNSGAMAIELCWCPRGVRHTGRSACRRTPVTLERPATEGNLSRKSEKNGMRCRGLNSTEAKACGGRNSNTRAGLEEQLMACRRQVAQAHERLIEAVKQQTATSKMLRTISNSPIQSVLDAVAENAARLCDANNARIWRLDDSLLRIVAAYGQNLSLSYGHEDLPVNRDTVSGRATCDRRPIHVSDLASEEDEYPVGTRHAKEEGYRTALATPLLCEGTPVGIILVRRAEVRPFDDRQIALLETFADQAVIAIENVRLFEAEKTRALALARSEMNLAQAQRLSQTGSYSWKPDKSERHWSDEIYRIFDIDPAPGPDIEKAFERVHPDQRERIRRVIEAQARGEVFTDEIFRLLLPDGSIKFVHLTSNVLRDDEGVFEIVGAVSDITKIKAAEDALRENEQRFRDYAETASDWFWEIGPDYKFTRLTRNAFDSDPADRIGSACWDHALDLETEPEKWRIVWETLDARKPFRDFVYCSAGGNDSPIYVKASGKPVFDVNGAFRGYRGTGTDVTAIIHAQEVEKCLRTLQAEFAHVSRVTTLGQLTASIAHEVTQPIAAAHNNARAALNFLDNDPPDLGEVREALGCIVEDADRAGNIIDRIRDQIKKTPPRKERFDLNGAINEVIVLARTAIAKNGVVVEAPLSEDLLPVEGDRVQLQQVVLNLILNAVEAMDSVQEGPRELAISTEQSQARSVLVAIRDSGPGVDPENRERVFDAFYTTKSSGVGMGLAICRSIIDAHGGRLWVDGNEPQGAVFQFTLPSAGGTYESAPKAKPCEGTVSGAFH
jgi:signal transduction histidine kinase